MPLLKCISVLLLTVQIKALQNPYCSLPCDFGSASTYLHTVCERNQQKCGPDPSCGPDFREVEMTDELRQYVLDLHNHLRNNVASGNETRDNQPAAKKMMALNYDKELEFIAQCWANTCKGDPLTHDVCRATKKYEHIGQNLGFINSSGSEIDIKESVHQLIMYWYDEVELFRREWVDYTEYRKHVKVGHYTQMLWADTDAIGCAMTYYTTPNLYPEPQEQPRLVHTPQGDVIYLPREINPDWYHLILVCNYSPGGNYIGVPLYESGTPCSGCPRNKPCGSYPALCGRSVPVNSAVDHFHSFFTF